MRFNDKGQWFSFKATECKGLFLKESLKSERYNEDETEQGNELTQARLGWMSDVFTAKGESLKW